MASNNTLESRNADKRDSLLKFYERGHKYEIKTDKKSKYTSVTTWNHGHFPRFNADEVIENIFKSKSDKKKSFSDSPLTWLSSFEIQ